MNSFQKLAASFVIATSLTACTDRVAPNYIDPPQRPVPKCDYNDGERAVDGTLAHVGGVMGGGAKIIGGLMGSQLDLPTSLITRPADGLQGVGDQFQAGANNVEEGARNSYNEVRAKRPSQDPRCARPHYP